jgi:hypothetical protein
VRRDIRAIPKILGFVDFFLAKKFQPVFVMA